MKARLALGLTDSDRAAQVIALAEEAGEIEVVATPQTSDDVIAVLAHTEVEVLVLDEELGPLPVLELARQLQAKHPAVGLLLLAAREATPDLLRQAVRAGFRDVLASPMTVEALADATARGATWAQAVRERSEADDLARVAEHIGGRIIAVAGAKGGVGCSTVALHVALAAAGHDSERPVCLAELDLQTGDLRSLLDLQSHRSIADLASVAEGEVTVRSLDDTLYVHTTGLRVLLAPERGEDGEDISASAARQILGALKFQYDIVICDVGSVMTEAGAVAVEMASNVLIVTTPGRAGDPRRQPPAAPVGAPADRHPGAHPAQPHEPRARDPAGLRAARAAGAGPRRHAAVGLPRPGGGAEHRASRAPGAGLDPPRARRGRGGRRGRARRRAGAGGCACAARRAPRRARRRSRCSGCCPSSAW